MNSDRVYVADFGKGNEVGSTGSSVSTDEGRIVRLATDSNVQSDVVKVAAPIGMALGSDGSLYVVEKGITDNRVVKFDRGSTTAVPLPFGTELVTAWSSTTVVFRRFREARRPRQ